MDLTFNIIFVPGTVRYLRLATASLLKHSPYRYRLVANGLDHGEQGLLRAFCDRSTRLEYFYYPTRGVLDHGTMLNLLFQREASPWFCIADSDIFATGPFHEELEASLPECDVFTSCLPISMDPEIVLPGFSGRSLQTPGGRPLAPTYFSVYRTELFRRIIGETRVGFEVYHPGRHLPDLPQLPDEALRPRRLDTAKLLSLLAHQHGARFLHRELPSLIHIGGISRGRDSWKERMANRLGQSRRRAWVLDESRPRSAIRHRNRRRKLELASASPAEREELRSRALRNLLATWFGHYFVHRFDGGPRPRFELDDPRLTEILLRFDALVETLMARGEFN